MSKSIFGSCNLDQIDWSNANLKNMFGVDNSVFENCKNLTPEDLKECDIKTIKERTEGL